ncbi:hypothetical protein WN55_06720 [Dufourea novaeangliae]|uniref:Uncharacterized protein n=1 Tax=Dufourea novaeangliae TaxID=178035 RepID=A0A154PQU6_DUFNO|nr:hypothetical protein WN55_06720 [Dufourea novaeangliae]
MDNEMWMKQPKQMYLHPQHPQQQTLHPQQQTLHPGMSGADERTHHHPRSDSLFYYEIKVEESVEVERICV